LELCNLAAPDAHRRNGAQVRVEDRVVALDDCRVDGDGDTSITDVTPVDARMETQVRASTRTCLELPGPRYGIELHDERADVSSDVEDGRVAERVVHMRLYVHVHHAAGTS
jgi:hypothetical protein